MSARRLAWIVVATLVAACSTSERDVLPWFRVETTSYWQPPGFGGRSATQKYYVRRWLVFWHEIEDARGIPLALDERTGRVTITAQNHEVEVVAESLPATSGFFVSQRNLNDGSVEGLRHHRLPIETVQYHPEGSPGPLDAAEVFDRFLGHVRARSSSVTSWLKRMPPLKGPSTLLCCTR